MTFKMNSEVKKEKKYEYSTTATEHSGRLCSVDSCYCDMLKNLPIDIAEKELVQENHGGCLDPGVELRGALVKAYYQNKTKTDR